MSDARSVGFLSNFNYPPLVAISGGSILLGLPIFTKCLDQSSSSLALLKFANIAAFATNVVAVSIPGRIDDQAQLQRAAASKNNEKNESSSLLDDTSNEGKKSSTTKNNDGADEDNIDDADEDRTFADVYSNTNGRSLVSPAPWAFAIWGVIYMGELAFCTAGLFTTEKAQLLSVLPRTTAPFVVANLMQSLWCAAFRPSYNQGWHKYVSVFMLGGTAYALSRVADAMLVLNNATTTVGPSLARYYVPMTIHFGWTTSATLVNINGAMAMTNTVTDSKIIKVGYASAIAGTVLGVGITIVNASPVYGLTLSWALAACGNGMMKERPDGVDTPAIKNARSHQKQLCYAGSAFCIAAAAYITAVKK